MPCLIQAISTFDIFLRPGYQTSTNGTLADVKSDLAKLLHGILDLLVLKALEGHPRNGADVARWIKERSKGAVDVGAGSLYTALHRLHEASLIEIMKRSPDTTPRAKTYRISREGRKGLVKKARQWREFSSVIRGIVGDAGVRNPM